jgi:hypothetical protein
MFKGLLTLWGFIKVNIQLIIVVLIGIAVVAKLGYEIYRFFFVKKDAPYCNGCSMCEFNEIKKKKIS